MKYCENNQTKPADGSVCMFSMYSGQLSFLLQVTFKLQPGFKDSSPMVLCTYFKTLV